MSDIIIKNISKSFGEKKVLDNFSFEIKRGKNIAVMGPSGCGKTTLLRILSGLQSSDSGEIIGMPDKRSFVFQENRLCEDFSAVGNIRMIMGKAGKNRDISRYLSDLGLGDYLNVPVKNMSGGMKRRVAIARALAADFDILFMDEPFKGLDEELKMSVIEYVKANTRDKTVIFVTHDLDEAEYFSDEIINLKNQ